MTRGQKALIAAIILLLLILLGVWLFMRPQGQDTYTPEEVAAIINKEGGRLPGESTFPSPSFNADVSQPTVNQAPPPPPDDRGSLRRIASAFAERYGSYSTEGNFENLVDLKIYMAPELSAWVDEYVAENRAKPPAAEYSGTTSRSISVDVKAFDETAGTATLVVKTQRREAGSTIGSERVYYQDLSLDFVKTGGAWKVSTVSWLPL